MVTTVSMMVIHNPFNFMRYIHCICYMYGACMVLVWHMYGTCMVLVWHMYGACMVHVWYLYGTCMVHVWCMYGACMVLVWYMYGTCMVPHIPLEGSAKCVVYMTETPWVLSYQ